LILFIETSTNIFNIALADQTKLLFSSAEDPTFQRARNIATLVKIGLEKVGRQKTDIQLIAVNSGPGGTNSVRSGVAFANSLGYSLKIPVSYYNSFEAIGRLAWEKYQLPVVCTAKAINGFMYLGLFEDGKIKEMKYGKLTDIFKDISTNLIEFVVAGMHRRIILEDYENDFVIHDSGIQVGLPSSLLEIQEVLESRKVIYPDFVRPLTENSAVFQSNNQ